MMRFRVEVMVILVAATTTHLVAALGKLIFVILMKLNIVDDTCEYILDFCMIDVYNFLLR